MGLDNGKVLEIPRPAKEKLETQDTFLTELPQKEWVMRMMEFQMKKFQKLDEEEVNLELIMILLWKRRRKYLSIQEIY